MKTSGKEIAPKAVRISSLRLKLARLFSTAVSRMGALRGPIALIRKPLTIVIEGAMLGLLKRDDMDAMVLQSYRGKPKFYDPNSYQPPYEKSILPELQMHAGNRRKMLDAFCGQGREAEIFARAGFEVTGVDHLDWMIEGAQKHFAQAGLDADFQVGDFLTMSAKDRYDIVYTSIWMYSTQQGEDRRLRFLEKCRELCSKKGIVVLSCVDAASFSQTAAILRFLIARVVGILTLGNLRSEFGERTYLGLFWHHLSEQTVHREFHKCDLKVIHTAKETGIKPTFYFLSLNPKHEG